MIKKNKQVKFGQHVFNTIKENPMKMAEYTLKLHPNMSNKRKKNASSSQRFTVFESFAKTSWMLFGESIM